MEKSVDIFWRNEGPTWLVLTGTFASWAILVIFHNVVPWYVLAVLGGLITAMHSSLVHESVHCLRCVPDRFREALFFLPIGVWYPYFVYFREHTTHHRDAYLTVPDKDPESFYFAQSNWQRLGPVMQKVMIANQTFAGRMILGPVIEIIRIIQSETCSFQKGESKNLGAWILHAAGLIVLFSIVSGWAGMPWWQYILFFALPGLAFSLIRSFIEHRFADDPAHRTAIVESGWFFSLLFLNNNLHVVHHKKPSMKWYEIPGYYRKHRDVIREGNGGFVFSSYGEIIRRYLFKPAFPPVREII